jgi:excisionase family DNA binding protein
MEHCPEVGVTGGPGAGVTARGRGRLEPLLLDVDEVAAVLGVGRTFVYELLRGEELPHCKLGTRTKIPASALDAYVQRRLAAQTEAERAVVEEVEARLRRRPAGRGRSPREGR